MRHIIISAACLAGIFLCGCSSEPQKGDFAYDLNFLTKHDTCLAVLKSADGKAQIIVSPKYQAKVFTSTAAGLGGKSLGYLKYEVFEASVPDPHMNGYGGENRFWLGPEGGQYSIYFAKDSAQVYDNWHTPPPFDTEAWDVILADADRISLEKEMEVTNYKDVKLCVNVRRNILLLDRKAVDEALGVEIGKNLQTVAYKTENEIYNGNDFEWTAETGTVCIWMLDMFNPGERAVTYVPYNKGDRYGKVVTSDYFGEIPPERLQVGDGLIRLKTDGKYRSKIGLNALRTTGLAGNYDPDAGRLTVIKFDVRKKATYLSQEWDVTKEPLAGDAFNAYNDGPLADGSIMGPFLELESVSPAAFLKPGEALRHTHTVIHITGSEKQLTPLAEKLFGQ